MGEEIRKEKEEWLGFWKTRPGGKHLKKGKKRRKKEMMKMKEERGEERWVG